MSGLKSSGLFWPTLTSLVMLGLAVGLGNWQLQRLAWKGALIEKITARTKAPPVSADQAEAIWRKTGDIEYLRVRAAGRFAHDKERYYYAPSSSGPGWHIYTPLITRGGRLLMVNRGFVPGALKAPQMRIAGQVTGEVEIVGLVRMSGEKGLFTPPNELQNNVWYWRSLSNMVATVVDKVQVSSYPFFLDAGAGATPPGGWPKGATTRLDIPNRHLEYALTWFALALTLIGVYLAYAWPRLKMAKP